VSPRERPTTSKGEPHDRLTRLANAVLRNIEEHPEYEKGMRVIVFVNFEERGGIGAHGYEDQKEAIVDLFIHLQAMFATIGKELQLMPIPNRPEFS